MKRVFVLLGILLLGLLAGCAAPLAQQADVMARVGNGVISTGDFKRSLQPGADPQQTLDQLIDVELVVQAARREGAGVDTKQLDEQIIQIRDTQGGGTDEGLNQFISDTLQLGTTDGASARLREVLVRQQLIDAMILAHSTVEQARASHILLQAEDPARLAERQEEATALLTQIQDGGDFAALAKEKSDDPTTKESGGDLGWQARGTFPPEFEETLFSMKPGELRLVSTQFGWHIVRLDEAPQSRGFESREELNSPAGQAAFQQSFLPWVESLRSDAEQAGLIKIVGDPAALAAPPVPEGQLAPGGQPAPPQGQPAPEGQPAPTTQP